MGIYESLQDTAGALLTKYGQACVLSASGESGYDAATGTATPPAPTDSQVFAAILDFPTRDIDGTLILINDKKVLLSPKGLRVRPSPSQTLTDEAGASYVVVTAKPTAPAGTVVLWTLQVRS